MATPGWSPEVEVGRYLVLLDQRAIAQGIGILTRGAGLQMSSTADFVTGVPDVQALEGTEGLLLDRLGVAVVQLDGKQLETVVRSASEGKGPILAIEPSRIVYAIPLEGTQASEKAETWGLQVTGAVRSRFSGKGIKLAVLDTGLDLKHPDFSGRAVTSQSFVSGESPQDGHGHGTHCAGTACGPKHPAALPRYGVAYDCEIFVGKVLNDRGRGVDPQILLGIEWAVNNGCAIVSMSLSAPTAPGQSPSAVFENVTLRAQAAGTLIIAAAGNDSRRDLRQDPRPVGHPANCRSIVAVGAVDPRMGIAPFSNGGKVDIAGPGVNVLSSWLTPKAYHTISGTSMATPHVAGIAALLAEREPTIRGEKLRKLLLQGTRPLAGLGRADAGAGLVQAP